MTSRLVPMPSPMTISMPITMTMTMTIDALRPQELSYPGHDRCLWSCCEQGQARMSLRQCIFAISSVLTGVVLLSSLPTTVAAQSSTDAELAKKLANPVAALISVPFQENLDFGIGSED